MVKQRLRTQAVQRDQDAEMPLQAWKQNTFYIVIDTILESLRSRYKKNELFLSCELLEASSIFQNRIRSWTTSKTFYVSQTGTKIQLYLYEGLNSWLGGKNAHVTHKLINSHHVTGVSYTLS